MTSLTHLFAYILTVQEIFHGTFENSKLYNFLISYPDDFYQIFTFLSENVCSFL